jgi:hypothetical protein
MDVEGGQMHFNPDEVESAGVPVTAGVDQAAILYQELSKTLTRKREQLWALQTADDDALTAAERAQILPLAEKVQSIHYLTRDVGELMITQEVGSFGDTEGI